MNILIFPNVSLYLNVNPAVLRNCKNGRSVRKQGIDLSKNVDQVLMVVSTLTKKMGQAIWLALSKPKKMNRI